MSKTLQKSFEKVRNDFFPRWDKQHEWKIIFDSNCPGLGKCDPKRKRILIQSIPDKQLKLDLLLIHEVSHAVASMSHDKKWITRLTRAGTLAEKLGMNDLAAAIQEEIAKYQNQPRMRAQHVYNMIGDAVNDTQGQVSYETIIKYISGQFGCYPEELESYYKNCRRSYDSAVKEYTE